MSITTELREWARDNTVQGEVLTTHPVQHPVHGTLESLLAIADRIDAEHKHAIAYVDDRDPETMAEHGWVRLPVDADGVPIRVGDVMEWPDCSTAEVVGIGNNTFFYVEKGDDAAEWSCANDKIHHHEPTVEDVLREFAEKVTDSQIPGVHPTYEEAIAEYAAKLRLAGDGE